MIRSKKPIYKINYIKFQDMNGYFYKECSRYFTTETEQDALRKFFSWVSEQGDSCLFQYQSITRIEVY